MTITIRFKLKSPDLFTDDDKPEDDPVDDPNDSEGLSRSFVTSTLLANDNKKNCSEFQLIFHDLLFLFSLKNYDSRKKQKKARNRNHLSIAEK